MKRLFTPIITLALGCLIAVSSAAQGTLELSLDGGNLIPLGPTTAAQSASFTNDALNPNFSNAFFSPYAPALNVTLSFKNQQRSSVLSTGPNSTPTATSLQGMLFGGRRNDPSAAGQLPGVTELYSAMGSSIPVGLPEDGMFASSPSAAPVTNYSLGGRGLGFDISGSSRSLDLGTPNPTDSKDDINAGFALFSNVEPLFDANENSAGRFYYGDLVITFNRPVKNPIIHFAGLGGSYSFTPTGGTPQISYFTTEFELVNNVPGGSTFMAGNEFFNVSGNNILNSATNPNGGSRDDVADNGFATYAAGTTGAASGSVRINGNVQELVYRVYVRGSASSNFNFSKNAISFGGASDPFNGDLYYVSISLDKPTSQQVSGNIFLDENGTMGNINNPNMGSGSGAVTTYTRTNINNTLNAVLVNPATGLVVATTPVSSDGTYLFDNVATGTYTVRITTNAATVGQAAPTVFIPSPFITTGEQIGLLDGINGANDGISPQFVISTSQILTNVNFGVNATQSLPANIVSFNGYLASNTSKLTWVVSNQIDVKAYEVERSIDGINFTKVGTVNATGNATTQLTYTYDDNVSGVSASKIYYRVRVVDNNMNFRHTNIIFVKKGSIKISKIFPNPFVDAVRIELETKEADKATIIVVDAAGRTVVSTSEILQRGGNQLMINGLGRLSKGTYVVEVITSTETLTTKLFKN